MFKIDKSSVEYMGYNMSILVVHDSSSETLQTGSGIQNDADDDFASTYIARQKILEAEQQAKQIVENARQKAAEVEQLARQKGYTDGYNEAKQNFIAHKKEQHNFLKAFSHKLLEFSGNVDRELEEGVVQLSLDIAEKIVNKELERDDTVFIEIVKTAIARMNSPKKFLLRVSRTDFDKFFSEGWQWLQDQLECSAFSIISDDSMESGGCVLESDGGIINAGVASQHRLISQSLLLGKRTT